MNPGKMFKGKLKLPILIGGGILLVVIVFGVGLLFGWMWGNVQGDRPDPTFTFKTVFNRPGDFRLIRVNLHLSSPDLAQNLRGQHRDELAIALRQVLDQNFRAPGRRGFTPTDHALTLSENMQKLLKNAFESQIRSITPDLKEDEGTLVLSVTIYFVPEGE